MTYSIDPATNGYGPIIGLLAASWETSADGKTWTFHLRPNVTWHDDSPMTADDVVFTFTLCEDSKVGCTYGGGIGNIAGAAEYKAGTATTVTGLVAVDPLTVTITTTDPNAALLDSLSVIPVLQKKSLGQIKPEEVTKSPYWSTPGTAMGTGPFKITALPAGPVRGAEPVRQLLGRQGPPRQDHPQGIQGSGHRAHRLRQGRDRPDLPDGGRGQARDREQERPDHRGPIPGG